MDNKITLNQIYALASSIFREFSQKKRELAELKRKKTH
jgi:hypothetical protein